MRAGRRRTRPMNKAKVDAIIQEIGTDDHYGIQYHLPVGVLNHLTDEGDRIQLSGVGKVKRAKHVRNSSPTTGASSS